MSYTSYATGDAETNKLWSKMLVKAERDSLDIAPLMGKKDSSIIHIKDETEKGAGDRVTFTLCARLSGKGFVGSIQTIEGNAESLSTFTDNIFIDEQGHNAGTKSQYTIDAQRVPFNLREECKDKLAGWWRDRKVAIMFNQACGYTPANTSSATTGPEFIGNNTVLAPAGTTGLVRQIWAGSAAADESLTSSDPFVLSLLDRAVEAARTGARMIQPVMIGGQQKYVVYLSEGQVTQLRTDAGTGGWQDITKFTYSGVDVSKNPLYTGALGEYNGCILRRSQDVPRGVNSSTGASDIDTRRAVLLGAQGLVAAFGRKGFGPSTYRWNEELLDHKRKLEVSASCIWGMKKAQFNSVDHGVLVISTYSLT